MEEMEKPDKADNNNNNDEEDEDEDDEEEEEEEEDNDDDDDDDTSTVYSDFSDGCTKSLGLNMGSKLLKELGDNNMCIRYPSIGQGETGPKMIPGYVLIRYHDLCALLKVNVDFAILKDKKQIVSRLDMVTVVDTNTPTIISYSLNHDISPPTYMTVSSLWSCNREVNRVLNMVWDIRHKSGGLEGKRYDAYGKGVEDLYYYVQSLEDKQSEYVQAIDDITKKNGADKMWTQSLLDIFDDSMKVPRETRRLTKRPMVEDYDAEDAEVTAINKKAKST